MREINYGRRPGDGSTFTNVIFTLLIVNGLIFALQLSQGGRGLLFNFALWPATHPESPFAVWQLLTYGFLHADVGHIAFNMFGLWMFGSDLERLWGPRRFLTYYLVCVIGAGLVQLIVAATQGGLYPTVGASGGVFGILLGFGLTFPNRIIMPLFPPIPMRAIVAVMVFGALELYFGFSGARPGVASFAHLGGMLFGFLVLMYWRGGKRR